MLRSAGRSLALPRWHTAILIAVVLAAYGGDVGKGFVKEDAVWIMHNRVGGARDVARAFTESGGFFRPIVGLSFAVNHWMFGGNPRGYGWTNLLLAIGSGAALVALARSLGLPDAAALLTAGLWILNFHGINMAVLWLSGRTALLLTLFALLAAIATVRVQPARACLYAFLAMASKEEGVLLPFVLVALLCLRPQGRPSRRHLARFAAGLLAVWTLYGGLRLRSDAITPLNAPAFYTFAGPDWSLRKNLAEYADRSLTFPVAVTVLAVIAAGRVPRFAASDRRLIGLGGIWLAAGFGLTVLLPARSSLYGVFPSVGSALAGATIVAAAWRLMPATRQRRAALIALILPVALVPVYWQRNVRWTELAALSSAVVDTFRELVATAPARWEVIVIDDRSTRANIAAAVAIPDAVELATGKRPHIWLVPPPDDLGPDERVTAPARADALLALRAGRIVRLPFDEWRPAPAADLK